MSQINYGNFLDVKNKKWRRARTQKGLRKIWRVDLENRDCRRTYTLRLQRYHIDFGSNETERMKNNPNPNNACTQCIEFIQQIHTARIG